MRKLNFVLFALAQLVICGFARGDGLLDSPRNRMLIKALSEYIVELNDPVYVYSWFDASNRNPFWKTQISANDRAGYEQVLSASHAYFQALCTNDPQRDPPDCTSDDVKFLSGHNNAYGPGFYASTDPVATAGYGGTSWVLLQIQLPHGFRFFDVDWPTQNDALPEGALNELKAMGCDNFKATSTSEFLQLLLHWNLLNQGSAASPAEQTCTLGLRRLLHDQLRIEGVYYHYLASTIRQCTENLTIGTGAGQTTNGNVLRQGAFLLANPTSLRASDVKVFNSQTRDEMTDRLHIVSLFYQQGEPQAEDLAARSRAAALDYYSLHGLPGFRGYSIQNWEKTACMTAKGPKHEVFKNTCGDWFYVCNASGSDCGDLPLKIPTLPKPKPPSKKISKLSPPKGSPDGSILWDDLDGMDQDPKLDDWVKGNLLGCANTAPFSLTPNLRYNRTAPK